MTVFDRIQTWRPLRYGFMTETRCQILKTNMINTRRAQSGDVIKILINIEGTGELANPTTNVSIVCSFWIKVLDKPPDRRWKKIFGGYLAPMLAIKLLDGKFIKGKREITFRNKNEVLELIDKALVHHSSIKDTKRS